MGTHESSVNFENLIRDLADMYPFDVGTVVLVELIANSLDSKATTIRIDFDSNTKILVVSDNGSGMTESGFDQYHDFAAGLKTRGTGIGFAGVGAKISFNIATKVVTETRSESFAGGSNWYLQSKKKLIWEDTEPIHLSGKGTRVAVEFSPDANLPFNSKEDIETLLRQHYLPLLDKEFLEVYNDLKYYSDKLRFIINGEQVEPINITSDYSLQKVRVFFPKKGGKRIGIGLFGLSSTDYAMGGNICGVLLSTWGKVIKADMFNQFPAEIGPRILGVVEIPELVQFLTSSKTEFFHRGHRHREFEGLYGPVRQEFKDWLNEIGVQSVETVASDDAVKLEKEIRKIINDIPELHDFFGFRGPKKIMVPDSSSSIGAESVEGAEVTFSEGEGQSEGGQAPMDIGEGPGEALVENIAGEKRATPIGPRTGRQGPKIAFFDVPDRVDLAWVDGNNIVINKGHPAFKKVEVNSIAKRQHCLFAIAVAIQKFLFANQTQDITFIDRMMTAWGKK